MGIFGYLLERFKRAAASQRFEIFEGSEYLLDAQYSDFFEDDEEVASDRVYKLRIDLKCRSGVRPASEQGAVLQAALHKMVNMGWVRMYEIRSRFPDDSDPDRANMFVVTAMVVNGQENEVAHVFRAMDDVDSVVARTVE